MLFQVKDCTLITRMAGIREAMNLRELEERLQQVPDECLFHHFCENVIRPTFDDPEYPNDMAYWAGHQLNDHILAERLAVINPYKTESFNDLRQQVLDIIQERLSELNYIPWAPRKNPFQFLQAVTVVFDTGIELNTIEDFYKKLEEFSLGSVYYHFVEARRRTPNGMDDFSAWLLELEDDHQELINSLAEIDFYFLSLPQLRQTLRETVSAYIKGSVHA